MDSLSQKIPEIKSTENVNEIPWEDAVVWTSMSRTGGRVYEYILKEHIKYVAWTNGNISIMPARDSMLSAIFQAIIINPPFFTVGKNVPVA